MTLRLASPDERLPNMSSAALNLCQTSIEMSPFFLFLCRFPFPRKISRWGVLGATIPISVDLGHPCPGITAFPLHLCATTELAIVNRISQHDPQPDPEFASRGHSRLPQFFLD
jgi:hypothetical protein